MALVQAVCLQYIANTYGITYRKVCMCVKHTYGMATTATIDSNYVDGLSITYGNPRQHIWTYATGVFDNGEIHCPCDGTGGIAPSFVGSNYYCESGRGSTDNHHEYHFDDPLWDGSGCIHSNCCSAPNQPWFYR